MIIQHIVFPQADFNPVTEAFFRLPTGCTYTVGEKEIALSDGAVVQFNTYYNALSVEKLQKYTIVRDMELHLFVRGDVRVSLYNAYRSKGVNTVKALLSRETIATVMSEDNVGLAAENVGLHEITIPIPDGLQGVCYFEVTALSDMAVFCGGHYSSRLSDEELRSVRFAIDICTYKRERFVARNMQLLANTLLADDSPVKGCLEIFIADNGQSLTLQDDCGGLIHVYPNKNAGGAGGFGRAMIEILKSPNYSTFSHILMMDDDIVFSEETVFRTLMIARTLKPEFRNAFVGGAMLSLEQPSIQVENFDNWKVESQRPIKYRYNITDFSAVLKNEKLEKGNYFGWWYCLMPIGVVKANNLPLPIFIKRDDIEYGMRNGHDFITLNGLSVLHMDFSNKRRGFLEYYYWRNRCILNALYRPSYTGTSVKKGLSKFILQSMLMFRYEDANLAMRGVEDFLRGVDWLKKVDPVVLNEEIANYTYHPEEAIGLKGFDFSYSTWEKQLVRIKHRNAEFVKKSKRRQMLSLLKDWVRGKGGVGYVPMCAPSLASFKGLRKALSYDEGTGKAFITARSWRSAWNLWRNYRRVCRLIDKSYDDVIREFKFRFRELTSLDLWEKHLGLSQDETRDADTDSSVIVRDADRLDRLKASRRLRIDRRRYSVMRLWRMLQVPLSLVLPVFPSRITFYLHARRGYTCNLKYILEELLHRYPNRSDVIWVSDMPEAVAFLQERGVRTVRLNTVLHWWYQFTSKLVVTNDSFPPLVRLRARQKSMNTWHAGMNYKHIGPEYCTFRNKYHRKMFLLSNPAPTVYMAGSAFFADDTSKSFHFKRSIFKHWGMARNDIFFRDNKNIDEAIRKRYFLSSEDRLVLYAPTFRDGFCEDLFAIDFDMLRQSLSSRFGGNWKVLYRKHYFIKSKDLVQDSDVINVSDYDDMNELLAVADVLISDYSSCFWDFALTKRPSFVYATDIANYQTHERSFAYPLEKWPFPIACTNFELRQQILEFDSDGYAQKVSRHLADGGSFDQGEASARAVDYIAGVLKLSKTQR